jgi:hypothetical protein
VNACNINTKNITKNNILGMVISGNAEPDRLKALYLKKRADKSQTYIPYSKFLLNRKNNDNAPIDTISIRIIISGENKN